MWQTSSGSCYCFPHCMLVRFVSLLFKVSSFSYYPLLHLKGPLPVTLKGTDAVSFLIPLRYIQLSEHHHTHAFLVVLYLQLLICKIGSVFLCLRSFYLGTKLLTSETLCLSKYLPICSSTNLESLIYRLSVPFNKLDFWSPKV